MQKRNPTVADFSWHRHIPNLVTNQQCRSTEGENKKPPERNDGTEETVRKSEKLGRTVAESSTKLLGSADNRLPLGVVHLWYCQVFVPVKRSSLHLRLLLALSLLRLLLLRLPLLVVFRFLLLLFLLRSAKVRIKSRQSNYWNIYTGYRFTRGSPTSWPY